MFVDNAAPVCPYLEVELSGSRYFASSVPPICDPDSHLHCVVMLQMRKCVVQTKSVDGTLEHEFFFFR